MRFLTTSLAFLLLAVPSFASAQDATGLSKDPAALLTLAYRNNGLDAPDVKPWHIRGTYKLYSGKGKVVDQGIYEEWWLSPSRYKRTIQGTRFKQTDFADGTGLMREGDQEWQHSYENWFHNRLMLPVPPPDVWGNFKIRHETRSVEHIKYDCAALTYSDSDKTYASICLDPARAQVRQVSIGRAYQVEYGQVVELQGHYLSKDMEVFESGKLSAALTLDTVELLNNAPDSLLASTPASHPVALTNIQFGGAPSQTSVVSDTPRFAPVFPLRTAAPEFPLGASGYVVLDVTFGPNGHATEMTFVKGTPALAQVAAGAANRMIYWPLSIMGAPRSFKVPIVMAFNSR